MLLGINVAVPASEIALGEDVKKKIGGMLGEGDGFSNGHIFSIKRLTFFLAIISSSLVARKRMDINSANMR